MTNKAKRRYRIRNWPDYNSALIRRGSLTLWVEQGTVSRWRDTAATVRRGRRRLYSDPAITCALTRTCSVGFLGEGFLLPTDVSFSNNLFQEGVATATASGFFASANGAIHPLGGTLAVSGCNSLTGCIAFDDVVDSLRP